jgi:hypothetical protein
MVRRIADRRRQDGLEPGHVIAALLGQSHNAFESAGPYRRTRIKSPDPRIAPRRTPSACPCLGRLLHGQAALHVWCLHLKQQAASGRCCRSSWWLASLMWRRCDCDRHAIQRAAGTRAMPPEGPGEPAGRRATPAGRAPCAAPAVSLPVSGLGRTPADTETGEPPGTGTAPEAAPAACDRSGAVRRHAEPSRPLPVPCAAQTAIVSQPVGGLLNVANRLWRKLLRPGHVADEARCASRASTRVSNSSPVR